VPDDDAGDVRPVTVVVGAGTRALRDVDSVVAVDPAVVIVVLAVAVDLVRVVPVVAPLRSGWLFCPPRSSGVRDLRRRKSGST